jgi:uncharacterized protein (DUF433 family)
MDYKEKIESNPDILLGKPVVKGTRITVEIILRKLASGYSTEEVLKVYPHLTKEDILASIDYAASVISNEEMLEAE